MVFLDEASLNGFIKLLEHGGELLSGLFHFFGGSRFFKGLDDFFKLGVLSHIAVVAAGVLAEGFFSCTSYWHSDRL